MTAMHVVYRGPLERSRLRLLLRAAHRAFGHIGPLHLTWLAVPSMERATVEHFQDFVSSTQVPLQWELVDGRYGAWPAARARLRKVLESTAPLLAIGSGSLEHVSGARARALLWSVNGIPEEREMTSGRRRDGLRARADWLCKRALRIPDLTITVSTPMSDLVRARTGYAEMVAVPSTVDRETFRPTSTCARDRIAYLGTGAAWQRIDETAAVWRALAQRDEGLRFRVISRDARCQRLVDAVPANRVEFVGVAQPEQVAALLQDVDWGFVLRDNHLVNRVSSPTKAGEYLASGVGIVTTSLAWDLSAQVRAPGASVLVDPASSADEIAAAVLQARARIAPDDAQRARRDVAATFDRELWAERLAARMRDVVGNA